MQTNIETFDYRGSKVAKILCSRRESCENPCSSGQALLRLSEVERAQQLVDVKVIVDALTYSGALCAQEAALQANFLLQCNVQELALPE